MSDLLRIKAAYVVHPRVLPKLTSSIQAQICLLAKEGPSESALPKIL